MANIFLDVGSLALVGQTILPVAMTTTTNGATIDLVDSNAVMASALVQVGAVVGTQGTADIKIQESTQTATTGTWTDITGATFTQITTSGVAGTSGVQIISFQRNKRYVRAYATYAGTFTSMVVGVSIFSALASEPSALGGWVNEAGAS